MDIDWVAFVIKSRQLMNSVIMSHASGWNLTMKENQEENTKRVCNRIIQVL